MKLKAAEFTINKSKGGKEKAKKEKEKKKRKRDSSQSSVERGRSKSKDKKKVKRAKPAKKVKQPATKSKPAKDKKNKKKQKKKNDKKGKKRPVSRESSVSSVSRGRSPKRRTKADADGDESTISRTTIRDSSVISSRASSMSDLSNDRPWKKKKSKRKNPILYSCCGFCSLGAGSLLTALIYVGLCIGFLVYRIGDFNSKIGKHKVIWSGNHLHMDIWRILLIVGIAMAAISMVGALVLLVASCLWGQKEHYKKIRNSVAVFAILTGLAIVVNLGEAIFATVIPLKVEEDSYAYDEGYQPYGNQIIVRNPKTNDKIKDNLVTSWALTGVHALGYVYLMIVLVSYLRLLKYRNAPKVGTNPDGSDDDEEISLPSLAGGGFYSSTGAGKTASRASSSFRHSRLPSSQSGFSVETGRSGVTSNGTAYMNWPMTNGAYVPESDVKNDDDTQTVASSFYDLPPGNVYDETPEHNDILPSIPKRDDKMQNAAPVPLQRRAGPQNRPAAGNPNQQNQQAAPPSRASSKTSQSTVRPNAQQQQHQGKPGEPQKPQLEPAAVSSFFKRLNGPETRTVFPSESSNPMEEMFRLFGSDLCAKHPENCDRYLRSYKDIRSKTSHINSPRDAYEFEGLRKSATTPKISNLPEEFSLDEGPYSLNAYSMYGAAPHHPIPHHQSISTDRPEPIYGYRPQTRDKNYPRYPPPPNRPRGRTHVYPQSYPYPGNPHHHQHDNNSIYYDGACSTCYGDFSLYGDYGSYYSYRGDGGYPPPPMEPPPVYTPTPSRPPRYDPSMQQFSAMSDIRRPRSKNSNSTWIPLNMNDDYSTYLPSEAYSMSTRTRSMPNLAPGASKGRHGSVVSDDEIDPQLLVSPEITIPSPREARMISRSSSWSNVQSRDGSKTLTRGGRSQSMRNYKGYHSGDLRRRTSYTAGEPLTRSEWAASRNSARSRPQSRNSNGPKLPPRDQQAAASDAASSFYEDVGSVYSAYGAMQAGASSNRRQSIRTRTSNNSGSNFNVRNTDRRGSGSFPDSRSRSTHDNRERSLSRNRRSQQSMRDDVFESGRALDRRPSRNRSLPPREDGFESRNSRRSSTRGASRTRSGEDDRERFRDFERDAPRMERGRSSRRRNRDEDDKGRFSRRTSSSRDRVGARSERFSSRGRSASDGRQRSKSQERMSGRRDEVFTNDDRFGRSESLRFTKSSSDRRSNKQVKFGSSPNLHHI